MCWEPGKAVKAFDGRKRQNCVVTVLRGEATACRRPVTTSIKWSTSYVDSDPQGR